ncbi:hypothetical protein MY1884_004369 [Beauveria asiatica]
MPSLVSCLLAGLAVADRAAAARYSLSKTYDSSNFLDEFHFGPQDDNWASVRYQNVKDAVDKGIVFVKDNKVYLGLGSELPASLQVQSKESFREGLVITRFYHMPKPVCGASFTRGEYGSLGGAIGMYSGDNVQPWSRLAFTVAFEGLAGKCDIEVTSRKSSGGWGHYNCNEGFPPIHFPWDSSGCYWHWQDDVDILGSPDGGIQALEWTEDTIRVYTWQIGKEPKNIDSKNPDTSSWGLPSTQLISPACDVSRAFKNQTILFTLSLCNSANEWGRGYLTTHGIKTCKQITGAETCAEYVAGNPEALKDFYFGINDVRIFAQDAEESDDNNANTKGQLSLDGSSPPLTFKYATSQSSSDNWIGIWPEDDTQAPTWGSITWDYARESSGSLQLTPPSSMKAGKYKAYLLSSDRTSLAFLSSFDYKPESLDNSDSSSSVVFSVKTHYNTNCGGSVNNNVDIKPGNGVCVRTNCDVGSLEIPSVGSCPDGQVRISYWQNADCGGDWYGYGYGSRGTCRGLWSNGWGFKSLWISCADPASDCIQQGTCTAAPQPATEVCRAGGADTKPDAGTTTDAAFHLKTRYYGDCTGAVHNEVTVPHGNGQCIDTDCAVGSLDIDSVGNCPDGELRISYWDQPGCSGKWFGYGYGSRNTCRSLWSGGWGFKSLWVSCAKESDDCVSRGTCAIDDLSGSNVC